MFQHQSEAVWHFLMVLVAIRQSNTRAEGGGYGPEIVGYVTTPLIQPPLQEILDPPLEGSGKMLRFSVDPGILSVYKKRNTQAATV